MVFFWMPPSTMRQQQLSINIPSYILPTPIRPPVLLSSVCPSGRACHPINTILEILCKTQPNQTCSKFSMSATGFWSFKVTSSVSAYLSLLWPGPYFNIISSFDCACVRLQDWFHHQQQAPVRWLWLGQDQWCTIFIITSNWPVVPLWLWQFLHQPTHQLTKWN